MNTSFASNLSQTERLAMCDGREPLTLADVGPDLRVISTPSNGFRMPNMDAVRLNDARMWEGKRYHAPMSEDGDECPALDGEDDEQEVVSYRSYHLPSMRTRGDVVRELRGMGVEW